MCEDYYGDLGCCLTCTEYDKMYEVEGYSEDPYDGSCLCYSCKCTRCIWYVPSYDGGYCRIAVEGFVEMVVDWKRNCITAEIKHAKKKKFREIIDILKRYGFVFLEDEKIWLKTIDRETVYNVRKELRAVTILDYYEKGKPPKTVKQLQLDV